MAGRLRARAIAIMKQLDAGTSYRDMIERDLAARLGGSAPPSVLAVSASAAARVPAVSAPSAPQHASACSCGTQNDADALYCKSCGAKLETV
jgi:hypothetical protein